MPEVKLTDERVELTLLLLGIDKMISASLRSKLMPLVATHTYIPVASGPSLITINEVPSLTDVTPSAVSQMIRRLGGLSDTI